MQNIKNINKKRRKKNTKNKQNPENHKNPKYQQKKIQHLTEETPKMLKTVEKNLKKSLEMLLKEKRNKRLLNSILLVLPFEEIRERHTQTKGQTKDRHPCV